MTEVGARIRRLREKHDVSGRELARRLNVAQSYVSKVEHGLLHPKLDFCEKVADCLKLSEDDRKELLNAFSLYAAEHFPLSTRADALQERQSVIKQIESTCTLYRSFAATLIPGLLQTEPYMRRLFESHSGNVADAISERLERQLVIKNRQRDFRFLLAESCLLKVVCSPKQMLRQLKKIEEVGQRPNVKISFLPGDAMPPLGAKVPGGDFAVLDRSVVLLDTLSGFLSLRHPDEVAEYADAFDRWFDCGLQADDMENAIKRLILPRIRSEA